MSTRIRCASSPSGAACPPPPGGDECKQREQQMRQIERSARPTPVTTSHRKARHVCDLSRSKPLDWRRRPRRAGGAAPRSRAAGPPPSRHLAGRRRAPVITTRQVLRSARTFWLARAFVRSRFSARTPPRGPAPRPASTPARRQRRAQSDRPCAPARRSAWARCAPLPRPPRSRLPPLSPCGCRRAFLCRSARDSLRAGQSTDIRHGEGRIPVA